MRSTFVFAACWLATSTAFGQAAVTPPPDPFKGSASLGYLATSGNTDSTNANAALGIDVTHEVWSHEFDANAVTARNDDVKTAEAYRSDYKARRSFGENDRSYVFGTAAWRQDQFSAYDREVSSAIGYGRRLVDNAAHKLNAEIGAGSRRAELRDGPEEDDGIARGALDYTWTLSETSNFEQDLIVESGSTNTTIESISALKARIVGELAVVLSYRVKRNSDVPVGVAARDTFTSVSLEYGF
jgi:putative salt-induced outer membrane protein